MVFIAGVQFPMPVRPWDACGFRPRNRLTRGGCSLLPQLCQLRTQHRRTMLGVGKYQVRRETV